jgi:hypothetical protein
MKKEEPRVGIFWLVNDKLVIDSTPLSEAEAYGDHLTHPRSHLEVWTLFQRDGAVPKEVEYEEPPRGRVMYNTKTRQFMLLADRCVLKDKSLVKWIMSALSLKKTTKTGTDEHYQCSRCLQEK